MYKYIQLLDFFKTLRTKRYDPASFSKEVLLKKKQLLSPLLKECIKEGFFKDSKLYKYNFVCIDSDLFFNTQEALELLETYQSIKDMGGEVFFEEIVSESYDDIWNDRAKKLSALTFETDFFHYSFDEMMQINKKLYDVAKKINSGLVDDLGLPIKLSPFEKYLLCYRIVQNVPYYNKNEPNNSSHSYVETVMRNAGCCAGKAKYLQALLKWVGIDSCDIAVSSKKSRCFIFSSIQQSLKKAFSRNWRNNDEEGARFNFQYNQKYMEELQDLLSITHFNLENSLSHFNETPERLKHLSNHKMNLVYLKDDKYGLDGVFAADPTANWNFDLPSAKVNNLASIFCGLFPLKIDEFDSLLSCDSVFDFDGKNLSNFASKLPKLKTLSSWEQEELGRKYLDEVSQMLLANFDRAVNYNNIEVKNNAVLKNFRYGLACARTASISDITSDAMYSIAELDWANMALKRKEKEIDRKAESLISKLKFALFKNKRREYEKYKLNNLIAIDDNNKAKAVLSEFLDKNSPALIKIAEALEARTAFEKLPEAKQPPFEAVEYATQKIDRLYQQYFKKEDEKD